MEQFKRKNYIEAISKLLQCEPILIPDYFTMQEKIELFLNEYEMGKNSGYTPVIILANDLLYETLKENYEEEKDITELPDGEKLLNDRCKECLSDYDTCNIYSEYSDKIKPCKVFLSLQDLKNCKDKIGLFKIPVAEPWKIFSWFPFGGWNDCPDTEEIMAVCKYWYEKYGAVPAVITSDSLELYVASPVNDLHTAFSLAKEQYGFCNDIVEQGTGTIRCLAETILHSSVGLGSDNLDVDVVRTSKEESLTNWEVGEALLFLFGELENIGQNINGRSTLFEE